MANYEYIRTNRRLATRQRNTDAGSVMNLISIIKMRLLLQLFVRNQNDFTSLPLRFLNR